jgi:hypothetical protein
MMRGVRRLVVTALIAVAVFVGVAFWNGFVAVLFGIAALTWVLAEAYRLSQGGDLFDSDESRRQSRRRD